jgi:hypothetical protein
MPPTFQQMTDLPNDRYQVVEKPTSSDGWGNAPTAVHSTQAAAVDYAISRVQPPHNAYQAMVLAPLVAFQKAS